MPTLNHLPLEIILAISFYLSTQDIKRLRLVARGLRYNPLLHINRVFISPSKRNLEVFKAIADHPIFRYQVKEIIWDDVRFDHYLAEDESKPETNSQGDYDAAKSYSEFVKECDKNLKYVTWYGLAATWLEQAERVWPGVPTREYLSVEESFALYQKLYKEQEAIISSGEDAAAFRLGLKQFPALKRVTVTVDTYGRCYLNPKYHTPLIRSFPPGFNFPHPKPWLDGKMLSGPWEKMRHHWHGYCTVVSELTRPSSSAADRPTAISEFRIEANFGERSARGIGWPLFSGMSRDYENLRTLCAMPSLQHLELSVNSGGWSKQAGNSLENGLFSKILAAAVNLKVLKFGASVHDDDGDAVLQRLSILSALPDPASSWPHLQCLRLSGISARLDKFINFLSLLPGCLGLIEFHDVEVVGGWRQALTQMRDKLGWRGDRPTVCWRDSGHSFGVYVLVKEEIAAFFDGSGSNVFESSSSDEAWVKHNFGRRKCDFDETFDFGNVNIRTCIMGVCHTTPSRLLKLHGGRRNRLTLTSLENNHLEYLSLSTAELFHTTY
ncbi:hypothetical protein L228DRAFT_242152 [Xylona heveae TC161]|uniref:F-box domain-containing protein n=1 Tax=Xylona heveae (strain CBS 132557 / TC161) TaxID=1328760 RepID=A0A164Z9Q6_XYLHT|nr:hypothetical protein L228DRAFT_242152 [Xylona heveae TC161]KZF18852.1 hypothetical protein L228DRAFT_242152 [Xylona heveae TC161]